MGPIRSCRDLEVWQRSMDLVDLVIEASGDLPPREFDLRRQMRNAATSIPANVAEGLATQKTPGCLSESHFDCDGFAGELETECEVAFRQGWLNREKCQPITALCARVGAMLDNLYDALD